MTATVYTGETRTPESAVGTKLTQKEVERGRLFLQQTRNAAMGATKGLSAAQWKFKPAPETWSIAEILDHIVIVQEMVLGPIREALSQAPVSPHGADAATIDAMVIHQFPTRLDKYPAPEFARPAEQIVPAALQERLERNYTRFKEWLESGEALRGHAVKSPPLQAVSGGKFEFMDEYQFILAAAAHTERHVKQMLEVMADAGYPSQG